MQIYIPFSVYVDRITVFVCSLKVCVLKKTNIVSEASCFKIKLLKL